MGYPAIPSDLFQTVLDGLKIKVSKAPFEPMPDVYSPTFVEEYAHWQLGRKIPTDVGIDRADACLQTYLVCEEKCKAVNEKGLDVDPTILAYARRIIYDILGPFNPTEWLDRSAFSGGASTQRRRSSSFVQNKYGDTNHCTSLMYPFVRYHFGDAELHNHCIYKDVPKDAKSNRPIEVQPQGNMYFQKGLGQMIRNRLLKVGIDLNNQNNNRQYSQIGSRTNAYSTIDLSSASDLISFTLVKEVMSYCTDWFDALLLCRVNDVAINGKIVPLQKFSGMGNGFTFELESLIFYSLVRATVEVEKFVGQEHILVYGDDIICSSALYHPVVKTLQSCGLIVNTRKSYYDGPFRESCGSHHYEGMEIPIFNIKFDKIEDVRDVYYLINQLRRSPLKVGKVIRLLMKYERGHRVPPSFSLRSGLITDFDVAKPTSKREGCNFYGWYVKYVREVTTEASIDQNGALQHFLDKSPDDQISVVRIPRGQRWRNARAVVPQWD